MNKKLGVLMGTAILGISSIITPIITVADGATAGGYSNQASIGIGVPGGNVAGQGNNGLIAFVQSGIDRILKFLGLIAVAILIWGGFQMVTAAGDDNKYKKGFTIVKQAVIGLILIGASAMIVWAVFYFMNVNATPAATSGTAGAAPIQ